MAMVEAVLTMARDCSRARRPEASGRICALRAAQGSDSQSRAKYRSMWQDAGRAAARDRADRGRRGDGSPHPRRLPGEDWLSGGRRRGRSRGAAHAAPGAGSRPDRARPDDADHDRIRGAQLGSCESGLGEDSGRRAHRHGGVFRRPSRRGRDAAQAFRRGRRAGRHPSRAARTAAGMIARLPPAGPGGPPAQTVLIAPTRDLGDGFTVRRALPAPRRRMVGSFIFFDQMGPAVFREDQGLDVRPHPHIGLATVSYLFEGEILHRDSLGSVQPIQPGAVNWMTAGRGIAHSERTSPVVRATGGALFGMQVWLALPQRDEELVPSFVHHPATTLPAFEGEGVRLRVITGSFAGRTSPVATRSETLYLDVTLDAGAR